jgi:ketosteroid isomerase-like protein
VSEGNVEIVRKMFAAWNRRDYAAAQTAFDPEVVTEMATGTDVDGTYEGYDGMWRLMRFWGAFSEFHSEVEEAVAEGDEVFTTVHHHGRGKASGAEVEMTNWQVFTFRGGRVVHYRVYGDRKRALGAAGISASD